MKEYENKMTNTKKQKRGKKILKKLRRTKGREKKAIWLI